MIELLVAVLVMGIGVLGVTGLQMVALQNNRDALMRTDALHMAYNIFDRIRVNPGAGVAGTNYAGVAFADVPTAPTDCIANQCTAAQIAAFDIALWQCSLGGHNEEGVCDTLRTNGLLPDMDRQPGLPDGNGQIAIDANGVVTVTVRWTGFGNAEQTVELESQG